MALKVLPSSVEGIAILGPDSPGFESGLNSLLGRAPRALLEPALPYSVIVENLSTRSIALLGICFKMTGPRGQDSSVVHYMDTLRNPAKSDLGPGSKRFVCAEPAYTSLVVRGEAGLETRARMNLDNLRKMLKIRASLDCVAFDDGEFTGPDLLGAFDRIAEERETESRMIADVLALTSESEKEAYLSRARDDANNRVRRSTARALQSCTGNFRHRIPLWRSA